MFQNEATGSDSAGESTAFAVRKREPLLERYADEELHDLVCVGFGPAALAIAVALYDALEVRDPTLKTQKPKVRFLERQQSFAWHAGMLLPGARLQISFIKDLATLRNPRSRFTFLKYLHKKGRLVSFANLGTFLPLRVEYDDYLRWCASHFTDVVDYGQTVQNIEPGSQDPNDGAVQDFVVHSVDHLGATSTLRARCIVIAVGGRPNIPAPFDTAHPRIVHSSEYATSVTKLVGDSDPPKSIAVVGAGQSAAEVFYDLGTRFPIAKSHLLIKDSALRPSDDSPFVNEIFDPERVSGFYSKDHKARASDIASNKATNYGVVRIELLEAIYATLYSYRITYEHEEDWPQRILTHCVVTDVENHPSRSELALRLYLRKETASSAAHTGSHPDYLDVDLLVVASGYRRDAHRDMLRGVQHMLQSDPVKDSVGFNIDRDYGIRFRKGAVSPDAGIWLQGCNESTHGLSDTLLSILATRGGEMVTSIFRRN